MKISLIRQPLVWPMNAASSTLLDPGTVIWKGTRERLLSHLIRIQWSLSLSPTDTHKGLLHSAGPVRQQQTRCLSQHLNRHRVIQMKPGRVDLYTVGRLIHEVSSHIYSHNPLKSTTRVTKTTSLTLCQTCCIRFLYVSLKYTEIKKLSFLVGFLEYWKVTSDLFLIKRIGHVS